MADHIVSVKEYRSTCLTLPLAFRTTGDVYISKETFSNETKRKSWYFTLAYLLRACDAVKMTSDIGVGRTIPLTFHFEYLYRLEWERCFCYYGRAKKSLLRLRTYYINQRDTVMIDDCCLSRQTHIRPDNPRLFQIPE